jgi:hypothetical protein
MFQNYYFGFVLGIAKRGDIMPQAWTLAATFEVKKVATLYELMKLAKD